MICAYGFNRVTNPTIKSKATPITATQIQIEPPVSFFVSSMPFTPFLS